MPKKHLKVAVLMGGLSAEREISLVTGQAVYDNLDNKKYKPFLVEMDKDCRFYLIQKNKSKRLLNLQNKDRKIFDLFFIALHGALGEDGAIQGMMESFGISYTGPGVLSSALAMNKVYAAQIYKINNLLTPNFVEIQRNGWKQSKDEIASGIMADLGSPIVIKPIDQGSAVGVTIVKTREQLIKAVDRTLNKFPRLMAQKFIKGKEVTCGVLEDRGESFALPPTHILPNLGEFYDYKSKYAKGGSTHICPADFAPEVNVKIQDLALKAHKALGCRGMSRTDIFVADDGNLYIIETNTIPGMTSTSLLPEAASKAGIDFSRMLDMIIKASL